MGVRWDKWKCLENGDKNEIGMEFVETINDILKQNKKSLDIKWEYTFEEDENINTKQDESVLQKTDSENLKMSDKINKDANDNNTKKNIFESLKVITEEFDKKEDPQEKKSEEKTKPVNFDDQV